MGKEKFKFTMALVGDESDNFSLSLDFNPPLKQHEQSAPAAYHFGLLLARIVAICSQNKDFGVELLNLADRYQKNMEERIYSQEAVNE